MFRVVKTLIFISLLLVTIGCKKQNVILTDTQEPEGFITDEAPEIKTEKVPTKKETAVTKSEFKGTVLAGGKSPFLDFNNDDYQKAVKSKKLVVLYFFANWCPTCKKEIPLAYEAFEELESEDVIGFRINYNDNETDPNEVGLAREFGVAYQHTKVFLLNGKRVLKSPESWNQDRYLSEINKYLNQ